MSLTFTDKEKRIIASLIQEHCDSYLSRFPFARYPNEPLEQWRQVFSDPTSIPLPTLRQALGWQFGSWQRKSLASSYNKTVLQVIKAWPEFTTINANVPLQTFDFWQAHLTDWQHGFAGYSISSGVAVSQAGRI
ncbi:hypothetical protein A8L34_23725 [Bacillus sp. FJAT-27264]|uniref:hypothetical protein n=1 Tax=Paenibacillus sp. (strain DSM 101736 / FJAT-27264) TaxID=1850362 RepID=UPI000807A7BB|nr:hypothetical protein [Bacillus sp. FJAT-27264]OBZ08332.1 hypothetical protein A8L34_23725 [Bacillus sp. FJAT-27264]